MEDKFKFAEKVEDMSDEEVNAQQEFIKGYKMPPLRPLTFVYEDEPEEIVHETTELIAVCPMTGLPDFYGFRLTYIPNDHIIELKSLKFYFFAYKDLPIFHEHLCAKILEDFVNAIKPKSAKLFLDAAARGGIGTQVTKTWSE